MIEDISIKTHLIVSDIHEEYDIKWVGRIMDTKPRVENGKPVFTIIGSDNRMELNTLDMKRIENCAKRLTRPRGRASITSDKAYIYIQEEDGKETLLAVLTHRHIKTYQQMFDKVRFY